jgi:transcription elongation GreA/GreB family factor/transcription elongation factor GreA-like protein
MDYASLQTLAKSHRWTDLEKEWMTAIELPDAGPNHLLPVIDAVVKAGQASLADTLGWAWLELLRENKPAAEAMAVGRELLVHLTDGEELRGEILELYRRTHEVRADLERWIERSGLKSGKSVRRALRYLDVGLQLAEGTCLIHRTEDHAAKIVQLDLEADQVTIKSARRTETTSLDKLIDQYDLADANDFRVLQQLDSARIEQLAEEDPAALAIGILKCHRNKIIRESMKLLLSPKYIPAEKWSDWWNRLKNETKKNSNLRVEGRSPIFLVYDEVKQTLEQQSWAAFSKARTPREWLEILEAYLRDTKSQKSPPDTAFLNRVQKALGDHINRFLKHKEPSQAFATALVIERVAADGLPVSTDAHGMALRMLSEATGPVAMVTDVPDTRLWSLAVACLEQAFPQRWPELFAELILYAPAGQCDALAKKVEKAGRGELLPSIVQRALAEPGRFTDAVMWVWKGPDVQTTLPAPPLIELLNLIMTLVGPLRTSEGKAAGQTAIEMRSKVRAGLSAKEYARFRECIDAIDDAMAQAVRRLIERGDGLGPSLQEDMSRILRTRFPNLYLKPKVAMWDDESVLYFTPKGLAAKEAEVALINAKMRENAKAIGEAASHGDLSENSEYKFALEERDLLRARLAKVNREISMAKVLERNEIPADHVSIGQRLTLRATAGSRSVQLTILGFDEADLAHHVYSYHSPLARQLLGRKPGDVVSVTLEGEATDFSIDTIESALG